MDNNNNIIETAAQTTEKVAKVAVGFSLIVLDLAATFVGALICAITSQD